MSMKNVDDLLNPNVQPSSEMIQPIIPKEDTIEILS